MRIGPRWEFIYNSINGLNEPDVCQWVRDETAAGGALSPLAEQIYQARDRLCRRVGLDPDGDPDLRLLLDGFEAFSRTCGRLMYSQASSKVSMILLNPAAMNRRWRPHSRP